MLYVIKYTGPFGFIKPWTAVRDSETFSQQFLTPSIIEGIEKKLFPELLNEQGIKKIVRHRLRYSGLSGQQEQTQPRGVKQTPEKIKSTTKEIVFSRPKSILIRNVLLNPTLFLAFNDRLHAEVASTQHICLCRNEDILMPTYIDEISNKLVLEISENEFDNNVDLFYGFELLFGNCYNSFVVGYNRFNSNEPMYGTLQIFGDNPLQTNAE